MTARAGFSMLRHRPFGYRYVCQFHLRQPRRDARHLCLDVGNRRFWPVTSLSATQRFGRFSNRPVGVKHFQAIHHYSVNVAHGLVLLFGLGARALPSWDPRTRRNNLSGGLTVSRTAGSSDQANSPHPSSREGHLSTAGWNSSFLLSDLIRCGCHAATAACCRVQRNAVPSTQMRCMITANRRASATIAFFMPRRLAICIAQALSQDHFLERIMA